MENYEEDLEIVEDSGAIEKVKKPHKSKGKPPSETQLANLQKGRDARKANFIAKVEEKAKEVVLKKPELVRQVAQSMPSQPPATPDPPKKPKKKANKQVIVLQDDSDSSDDEPQQIIIRRSKKKENKKKDKKPQIIQYESSSSSSESSSDDEPFAPYQPPAPPQNKIVFRRNY
jgi:hypothetical protein